MLRLSGIANIIHWTISLLSSALSSNLDYNGKFCCSFLIDDLNCNQNKQVRYFSLSNTLYVRIPLHFILPKYIFHNRLLYLLYNFQNAITASRIFILFYCILTVGLVLLIWYSKKFHQYIFFPFKFNEKNFLISKRKFFYWIKVSV